MYKPYSYGVPCCRLLGNSAFQNNEDNLYQVQFADPDYTIHENLPGRDA